VLQVVGEIHIGNANHTGADAIIANATANMSPMEAQGFRDSIRDNPEFMPARPIGV
jgi:hypothetical protein